MNSDTQQTGPDASTAGAVAANQQPETVAAHDAAPAADPVRTTSFVLSALIALSLLWYLLSDRFTPYTQQARVQAFVVPVAPEAAGIVSKVSVHNNQEVKAGEPLFELAREQYEIALERARADEESARRQFGASAAAVDAARAKLSAAQAALLAAEQDASRLERLIREDPGTISVRRLEVARAQRQEATGQVAAAAAEVQRSLELQGGAESDNAALRSARAAVSKAELDLGHTTVFAPAAGLVTDLRTDVGQFAAAGAAVMTLITIHDVWVSANMTENNLAWIQAGSRAEVILDALPGQVLPARVRSVGFGVSTGSAPAPGTLPTVQNSRDWLRQSQRFPVVVEFDPKALASLRGIRVGGQAEVMVYTGDSLVLNLLGKLYMRLMSVLSYVY
jgi:multidrug resistance efflux pump